MTVETIDLKENPTCELIASYFSAVDETKRTFFYGNNVVKAERLFTVTGNRGKGQAYEVRTNLLHLYIDKGAHYEHWIMDAKGSVTFKDYKAPKF